MTVLAASRIGARGAVVRLQPHDLGAREVVVEAEDLPDVGAAPAVDRLVVVAHHAHVAVLAADEPHDLVLRVVRVLVLVDQHVAVALAVVLAHRVVVAQQAHRLQQQVVEVERARARQELLVALPDRPDELVAAAARRSARNASGVSMRFLASEMRASTAEGCMVVSCTRSSRMADFTAPSWSDASQIVNLRGRPSTAPCSRRTRAQNAWKVPTVTSLRPRSRQRASTRSRISPAALFVKVTARMLAGLDAARDQVRDARGDHARLAGARAGQDQQRALGRGRRPRAARGSAPAGASGSRPERGWVDGVAGSKPKGAVYTTSRRVDWPRCCRRDRWDYWRLRARAVGWAPRLRVIERSGTRSPSTTTASTPASPTSTPDRAAGGFGIAQACLGRVLRRATRRCSSSPRVSASPTARRRWPSSRGTWRDLRIERADLVYVQSLGDDTMAPERIYAPDGVCRALEKARRDGLDALAGRQRPPSARTGSCARSRSGTST